MDAYNLFIEYLCKRYHCTLGARQTLNSKQRFTCKNGIEYQSVNNNVANC